MKINRQIRAIKVRVIDKEGKQVGVLPIHQALAIAEAQGLDLVEIAPNAEPPVCKIIDYGKFRYQQIKKEKESKKFQHQVKIKEIKVKPNTDAHDLAVKMRHCREFIQKGHKVRLTLVYRGREMMHPEVGERVIKEMCNGLADIASPESTPKQMGRSLTVVLAPSVKKIKEKKSESESENETQKSGESAI